MQIDPFQEAITFASTANLTYRRSFMPPESIVIIPKVGYDPARQKKAIQIQETKA